MEFVLRLTAAQHVQLKHHLFPGDGMEAAALVLCGRLRGKGRHALMIRKIVAIPLKDCERTHATITWPTRYADALINEAAKRGMAILKVHSHPGGMESFSQFDDRSDGSFLGSVHTMLEDQQPHASAVMLPSGRVFARVVDDKGQFHPVRMVAIAGDDIDFWFADGGREIPEFARRHAQVFGSGTVDCLRRLRVAVIGCSGTGSPLIEQLVRLGIRRLVLVDPDRTEWRNLNRIYLTTAADANLGRYKVEVLAEAIGRIGLGTEVIPLAMDLATPKAIRTVAACDLVFGCMDSVYGRDLLGRLASFYTLPYIDLGVQLTSLADGGVDQITGAVHYLQPGKSSLKSRGVYDSENVRAELMKRDDPDEYEKQLQQKYIRGVQEDRPAVISVNSMVASMAINEMLARIHRFRYEANDAYAVQRYTMHEPHIFLESEQGLNCCPVLSKEVGRGDTTPLLDKPELSEGGK
jgi:molybdopterin/thiamine biosynthesis adenylyltransferase